MAIEKRDNLIEIFEEEARVKHGGPLKSRRKSGGKLAPELGHDYISTDQIPNQDKQDGSDVGYDVDGNFAIGEDEIINQIDKKIAKEKMLKDYAKKWPKEGEVFVWRDGGGRKTEKDKTPKDLTPETLSPQYSPNTDKTRIVNLKAGRGSGYYRKDTRGELVSRYELLRRKKLIETKREMTNRAKKAERGKVMRGQFTTPKMKKEKPKSHPVRKELRY